MKIVPELQLNMKNPVLDMHSTLAYNIAEYIHNSVAKHSGYENCMRGSLNYVFIIQGLSLFREIGEDCSKCKMIRKKYLDIIEGPIPHQNFTIAPPFYITLADIFGPCEIYVQGHL